MDINKIIDKMKSMGCEGWEVTELRERAWEFYFIRHKLDQNRVVETRDFEVKLHRSLEGGEMIGRAEGVISPSATEAEVEKHLAELYYQASLVQNPTYRLADTPIPAEFGGDPSTAEEKSIDLSAIAGDFIRAIREVRENEDADINSYEIFAKEIRRHYRNSAGVEYACTYPSSEIEVVVNARSEGHEIELYRVLRSGTCDADKLRADVEKALAYGRDRLVAEPTPKLPPTAVVFSGSDAREIYGYFADRCMTDLKYREMSDWEIGRAVTDTFSGDRVSVEVVPDLPNSSKNYPVDEEGSLISPCFLIKDGLVESFAGRRQFSQYLGLERSFIPNNIRVSGGSKSEEEIRSGDYLELVEFSDFQVDEVGCDFAGEIRLGYLHCGGEVKIITGGSISGDMREAVKEMTFTKESVQYDNYEIPALTRLENVRITGIAD